MTLRLLGALLVVLGGGGIGLLKVLQYTREERALRQLSDVLSYMGSELEYRMTPLTELCRLTAMETNGCIRNFLERLRTELDNQVLPNAEICVHAALVKQTDIPEKVRTCLLQWGMTLGKFDAEGQMNGIIQTKRMVTQELEELRRDRQCRLRSYQTLGFCAGAALAVLFF